MGKVDFSLDGKGEDFESVSIKDIRNEIIKYKNDPVAQKLAKYYENKSYSEILGVSRKEASHSNFIAWLLDNNESHNLSYYPLKKFLEILVLSSHSNQYEKYKELFDSIITDDLEINNTSVSTEKTIHNNGRVDICIESDIAYANKQKKLRVVIENKVSTKEHSDQTIKYYNYFESLEDKSWTNLYVFLTPISGIELSELTEVECSCKEFIQTNYQNLVDYLLEPILNKNISNRTETIIKDYLQALSQPTQTEETEQYKEGLIMAIGKEERELLEKFWEQNNKLILSALYAISSDPKVDKDIRDEISSVYSAVTSGKDRSLISIIYNGETKVSKIKKSDIGYRTVKLLEEKQLINDEIFNFLREDKSSSFLLLKSKEEITETEIKYRKYRVNRKPELTYNGVGYYVVRNWGKDNIKKFIEAMTGKIDLLQYNIHG